MSSNALMNFLETKSMPNRSLLSLNNQQLNGNVRRLSQKFENLFEIKTESNEQLISPKTQLFISVYKSLENKKKKNSYFNHTFRYNINL